MGGIRLGRVLGFEIRLDYSWFAVFFLLAYTLATSVFPELYRLPRTTSWVLGIVSSLLLFVSVLVHELSHALVARRHGIEVTGITLFLFGGVAQIKGEPETPRAEFLVAVVGPITSVLLGLAALGISWVLPVTHGVRPLAAGLNYLGWVNVTLAVFNMVPGFPLDGGRILRAGLWRWTGNIRQATRWAANAGKFFAWVLIAYGVFVQLLMQGNPRGLWLIFVGWFLNNAAEGAYQQLLLRRALRGVSVADVMSQDVPYVDAEMRVPEFVDQYLLKHDHHLYPVERNGEFIGVVSVEDVRKLDRDLWGVTCVGSVAHVPERQGIVDDNEDAWDALSLMMESDSPRLLVMHEGRLEGVVSRDAIIRLVQRKLRLRLPAS